MGKYYIVAKIHPKAGKEEALQNRILANIPVVRKENGCLRYDLHKNRNDNTLMFYEIWADQDAFKAHASAPHMLAYREETKDWLEKPTEVSIWSSINVLD